MPRLAPALLIVFLCLAPGYSCVPAQDQRSIRSALESSGGASPLSLDFSYWSYRWGHSPEDPGAPEAMLWARTNRDTGGWQAAGNPFLIQKSVGDDQLWIRLRVPEGQDWVDPAVFFEDLGGIFVMYYDDQIIHRRGDMATKTDDLWTPKRKLIRLQPDPADRPRYLILRFYTSPEVELEIDLSDGDPWVGERFDILMELLRREIIQLILGSMFAVIGLVALGAYLRRRVPGSRLYLSFSIFTLFSGISTLNGLNVVHLLITMPQLFWDWSGLLATILLPVGILTFYEQVFGPGYKNCIRRLWQFHIVLSAALVVTVLLLYARYSEMLPALVVAIQLIILVFWISVGLMLTLLTITTFSSALRGNVQARLFFAGTLILSLSAVPDFVSGFAQVDSNEYDSLYHWGLLLFMVILLYIAEDHFEETRANLMQVRENYERTRRELANAKLKSLQERMNPHYLFNSLNTIHAMLAVDPPAANRALISLADNYRFLTEQHDRPLVPFDEEWKFLENYLELSQLRFRDTLEIRLERDGDFREVQVPPLIFQPIVENSIQHGLRSRSGGGLLSVRARRVGRWISVEFRDNGTGLSADAKLNSPEYEGTLGNIRSRLRYHFRGSALVLKNIDARENGVGGTRALLCFRDPGLSPAAQSETQETTFNEARED